MKNRTTANYAKVAVVVVALAVAVSCTFAGTLAAFRTINAVCRKKKIGYIAH